jgi:hypothetical protein
MSHKDVLVVGRLKKTKEVHQIIIEVEILTADGKFEGRVDTLPFILNK